MKKYLHLIILLLLSNYNLAQDLLEIARTNEPILLDAKMEEGIWQSIDPLPMTMYTPEYKGDMTEHTEIRMCYDDQFIYFFGIFLDSDPDGIMGTTLIRDGNPGGDFFNVLIDTYNDNENFSVFSTLPSGNRLDAEILNDGEGDLSQIFNASWNTFWTVKTRVDHQGWYAEMRIPFSSLRFNDTNGNVTFGLTVHRLIGRKNERHIFPAIRPDWDFGAWKPSQAKKILIKGIKSKRSIYATPYVLAGHEVNKSYDSIADQTSIQHQWNKEVGLDLKYTLNTNLTLDLTVNTDFAQVEADNVQVNLSRFSLFFPEKRQFFQERSGIFNFQTSNVTRNRIFHSRRIGLDEKGEVLSVFGGGRLVGRFKNLDIAAINMQTAGSDSIVSENFGVLRVKKRVINPYSFWGGIVTSRVDGNGNYNLVYSSDFVYRISTLNYLTAKVGHVTASNLDKRDNSMAYVRWERRAQTGLGYNIEMERIGENFNPGIGFIQRSNNLGLYQNLVFGQFIENSIIRKLQPYFSNSIFLRNQDNSLETQTTEVGMAVSFKTGSDVSLYIQRSYDEIIDAFNLSNEVLVREGEHLYYSSGMSYTMNSGRRLKFNTQLESGEYYDGIKYSISFEPTWTP